MGTPSAENIVAITQMLTRCSRALDNGDAAGFAECYAPNAEYVGPSKTTSGAAAIREMADGIVSRGTVRTSGEKPHVHFLGVPVIEGDDKRCTAQTYCVVMTYDAERQIQAVIVDTYDDVLVNVDGKWLFERRALTWDMATPDRLAANPSQQRK